MNNIPAKHSFYYSTLLLKLFDINFVLLKLPELEDGDSVLLLSLIEAYVTESSELQLFIQAVDSTRHLCSSERMQGSETGLLGSGEIVLFP